MVQDRQGLGFRRRSNLARLRQQLVAQQATRQAAELSKKRHTKGLVTYPEVVNAERIYLEAIEMPKMSLAADTPKQIEDPIIDMFGARGRSCRKCTCHQLHQSIKNNV